MGFSLKQFYCCGKLTSVSVAFIGDTNKKCGKGDEKTGCCDNEYKFFKVKDKHITAEQVNNPVKHFVDLHLYTPSFQNITFASQ
ncbi:MAG: hypothetical protein JWQ09_1087, partial [Segetibacter sp.]|nr:hypothetical protein [Segetibacter sp.]